MADGKKYPESFQEDPSVPVSEPKPVYAGPEISDQDAGRQVRYSAQENLMVYAGPQYFASKQSWSVGMNFPKSAPEPKKTCAACGAALPLSAKFCCDCGAKQPIVYRCPDCGKVYPEPVKFCVECGKKFPADI